MRINDLTKLKFKRVYDPCIGQGDVLNEVYIPCLKNSIKYDRCTAYFSNGSLVQMSSGLEYFVKENHGKIRFIFSCQISDEEMQDIISGYEKKMDMLSDSIDLSAIDSYELCNLSYLIANNIAEVKIAFMLSSKASIMHSKFGLFYDDSDNIVYFTGSGNETVSGLANNQEIITVSPSNNPAYIEDIIDGTIRFEKMWNNTYAPGIVRTEFPIGKLFNKLISFNQNRIFNSKEELYEFKNCVSIDIDGDNSFIMLDDYTSDSMLSYSSILATRFPDDWEELAQNQYCIKKLTVHNIRDILIPSLEKYGIEYVLSPGAKIFLHENDLMLENRIKLGVSIKTHTNEELWKPSYYNFKKIVDSEMVAKLRDKQMENAFFHYCMTSSADFSVPGTGKTYISYGLYSYLSSNQIEKQADHIIVFGPLNCFKAWKDEGKAIFGDKRRLLFFDANAHHGDFENCLKNNKYDVYLFNYDYVSEERIKIISEYILDSKTLVIFDEIHKLKNPEAVRAKLFVKLFDIAKKKPIYKLALTGTPIPNSFVDLSTYLRILYPDDLAGTLSSLSRNKLKNADNDDAMEKDVINALQPVFVRTTKQDLSIPPANPDDVETLACNPTDDESKLFEYINKSYKNPLLRFIRLIQASSNPELLNDSLDIEDLKGIYGDEEGDIPDYFDDQKEIPIFSNEIKELITRNPNSSKFNLTIKNTIELCNNGKKVLIWCLFIKTIDKVYKYLSDAGIRCSTISGRNSQEERDGLIEEFKNGSTQVLITNPNTLAESVSLHKTCHDAIYLEYGFNLTYLLQSKDRIHRVGLPEGTETNYYFAISKKDADGLGCIDEAIYDRLMFKNIRMKRAIESNGLVSFKDSSDYDDILSIINTLK